MRKRNHYFCCPWIRSGKFIPFLKFVVLITILGSTGQPAQAVPIDDSGSAHALWGEYNGNLYVLRSFYTPPETPEESNYFIDMQGGGSLRGFACTHGLTNNHALFVLSHGGAIPTIWRV